MEQTPLPMFGRSGERLPAVRHDSFLVATVNVRCGNDRIPVATGNCSNIRNGGLSVNVQQKFCPKMLPEFNCFEQKVQPKTVQQLLHSFVTPMFYCSCFNLWPPFTHSGKEKVLIYIYIMYIYIFVFY